jgi:hypothetical protein
VVIALVVAVGGVEEDAMVTVVAFLLRTLPRVNPK